MNNIIVEAEPVEQNEVPVKNIRITRINGISPRGTLPNEYLNAGDRIFAVANKRDNSGNIVKGKTIIVLQGNGKNTTIVAKLYPGKVIPINEWENVILPVITRAGDRLHDIRQQRYANKSPYTYII